MVRRTGCGVAAKGGVMDGCFAAYTTSVTFGDSCALRSTRSAALTAHRAVIHYRRLRFAYLKEKPLRLWRCKQQFPFSCFQHHIKKSSILQCPGKKFSKKEDRRSAMLPG